MTIVLIIIVFIDKKGTNISHVSISYLNADMVFVSATFFNLCPSSQIIISNDGVVLIATACFRNIYNHIQKRLKKCQEMMKRRKIEPHSLELKPIVKK